MKCKKCGRPMGSKGYCASCHKQGVQARKEQKAREKALGDKWGVIIGVSIVVIALAVILIFALGRTESTSTTSDTGTDMPATTAPAQTGDGELHAPGSFSSATVSGKHHVEIEIKDYGTIALELDADMAPITVANFLNLAESGFYDGLTFHRIIEGFMMQGGDPDGNGTGGSDISIQGEFTANGINNTLSHTRGAISMARNGYSMDSASSQFFIVHEDAYSLDGQYACFGYVTEGLDVVDAVCEYSSSVVVDGNGTVLPEDQPVITAVRVID